MINESVRVLVMNESVRVLVMNESKFSGDE